MPSHAVGDPLNDVADDDAVEDEEAGEVTIGLGGGGARKGRKGKKGRRKGKLEAQVEQKEEDTGGYPAPPFDVPADPFVFGLCSCSC